ncbi:hypothetical protein DTL42_01255 [Bremerella cremea]|uniref:Uncharacterized protein n=1 Tax=Bremerella cremea TaxID=1031537 RepID=A0A368KZT5_9BACT|nr:hypothetical protein [Bremerella cremea]RCS56044.1 hypothetical protein DTL42_01255 [Bremerella cremea]
MDSLSELTGEVRDRQWFIVRRWQTYTGELRALILRAIAVVVLYACQLGHHFLVLSGEARAANLRFQQGATAVAVLLLVVSLLTLLLVLKRFLPAWLPFLTTAIDLLAISALVALAGGPMMTSLTGAFYLVVAMAGLRFDLKLVWAATLGAMVAYLASVGAVDDSWFDADHVVPLVQQGVALACIGATGIVVGQVVRLARTLAEQYQQRVDLQQAKEAK